MSKTIRRKQYGYGPGKHNYPYWVVQDVVRKPGVWWEWRDLPSPEREEAIARFHSDAGVGDKWPVPAWFRRERERLKRSRRKAETRKILDRVRAGDYDIDDDQYLPRKKDVGWDWW